MKIRVQIQASDWSRRGDYVLIHITICCNKEVHKRHAIYLIFCKKSAGYQDKSSVSQIWYQCQVYENCQQILKFQKTDCISNLFRSGALPLAYETGRYTGPPVPVDDRLCVYCNSGRVKNEKHFNISKQNQSERLYALVMSATLLLFN
jgi:hypothetical protein